MNPTDDQSNGRVGAPLSDQNRPLVPPTRDQSASQNAAADVVRRQLNAIYDGKSGENTPHTTPIRSTAPSIAQTSRQIQPTKIPNHRQSTSVNSSATPHAMRTSPTQPANDQKPAAQSAPTQATVHTQVSADQWKQYHSAWQKYYQMYYERYYVNHLNLEKQKLAESQASAAKEEIPADTNQPTPDKPSDPIDLQSKALKELRAQVQQKVRESAKKVKKSRHFVPAMAGLAVLLVFMFLQWNRVIFGAVAAYTTPGNIDPQNIIVDASSDIAVSAEPRMIIPKINVDAPVIYGIGNDHNSQMKAMEKGIAHYSIPGASAVPGQFGNAVFAAHSSNDAFAAGEYKFVFAQNEKLTKGDVIYMNYESKRYTYKVTSMEVVLPTEVSKVQIGNSKPMLTLVSCVPLGTAEKRLLVFAEQISPDPNSAATATATDNKDSVAIPGKPSPTIIERWFGAS